MKTAVMFFLVLFLTAITAYGCVYLWSNISKQPEVSVSGVEYNVTEKITVLGAEVPTKIALIVRLEVYNPNIIPITVTEANYRVYLNSMAIGEGALAGPVEIPANGKTTTVSELNLSSLQALAGLLESAGTGTLKARINGTVNVRIPLIGPRPVYVSQETEILEIK